MPTVDGHQVVVIFVPKRMLTAGPCSLRLAPKDHKWLVHTGRQHSFGSEDYQRLEPTSIWHSFWKEENKRLCTAAVGIHSFGLRHHARVSAKKPLAPAY